MEEEIRGVGRLTCYSREAPRKEDWQAFRMEHGSRQEKWAGLGQEDKGPPRSERGRQRNEEAERKRERRQLISRRESMVTGNERVKLCAGGVKGVRRGWYVRNNLTSEVIFTGRKVQHVLYAYERVAANTNVHLNHNKLLAEKHNSNICSSRSGKIGFRVPGPLRRSPWPLWHLPSPLTSATDKEDTHTHKHPCMAVCVYVCLFVLEDLGGKDHQKLRTLNHNRQFGHGRDVRMWNKAPTISETLGDLRFHLSVCPIMYLLLHSLAVIWFHNSAGLCYLIEAFRLWLVRILITAVVSLPLYCTAEGVQFSLSFQSLQRVVYNEWFFYPLHLSINIFYKQYL